ncbi:MAG: hypothetical protein AB2637_15060, partial [Candidatus Thiodiazotropha sp.]
GPPVNYTAMSNRSSYMEDNKKKKKSPRIAKDLSKQWMSHIPTPNLNASIILSSPAYPIPVETLGNNAGVLTQDGKHIRNNYVT